MINIQSWEVQTIGDIDLSSNNAVYDTAYTFFDKSDDRCSWISNYLSNISKNVVDVTYCPSDIAISIAEAKYGIRSLDDYSVPSGKALIDATSLSLPELLHLFDIFNRNKKSFDVIYVQPAGYKESETDGVDKVKSYDLSDDGLGIQQVPPYIGYSSDSMIFFFLGFEGHRFGALINSDEFDTSSVTCLLGVPPFKLGWENKSLANNYKQLAEINRNSNPRFKFAGANDPLKTYEHIEQIYKAITYEKKNLCIAPFGTKPATIAAAQFAVNESQVVMLNDFVKKKNKRSSGTDLVHVWNFEYSEV